MQQIERYGVIALVFLLVTIVAVSFWGDSKSPGFWSRLTGRGAKKESTAQTQTADAATPPANSAERAIQSELPMNPVAGPAQTPAQAPTSPVTPLEPAPRTSQPSSLLAQNPPVTPPVAKPTVDPTPSPETRAPHSAPTTTPKVAASEYTVQKGDSMMQIATRMLGSRERWKEIRDMNPRVDPHHLKVGTKLAMPVSASTARTGPAAKTPVSKPAIAPASKEHPAAKSGSGGTYLVRKGDTMKSIAERELGDSARWKEIASANPRLDANHLSVGTSLKIPGGRSEPLVAAAMTSDVSSRPHVR
jgi:nucleoid-associated protein YgaU